MLLRFTRTGDTTAAYASAVVRYNGPECAGDGQALPLTTIGNLQITRTDASAGIAANFGPLTLITGIVNPNVVAKLSERELCMVGDTNPSSFADAAAVLRSITTIGVSNCYDKR